MKNTFASFCTFWEKGLGIEWENHKFHISTDFNTVPKTLFRIEVVPVLSFSWRFFAKTRTPSDGCYNGAFFGFGEYSAMKRSFLILLLILLAGLGLRLAFLSLIHNPGLHDQNHYYNLGRRLLDGEGFTIDYVWHYNDVPAEIVNPVDHWMPLPGVAVWAGMLLAGENARAALIFFIAAGLLLPLLSYWGAKELGVSEFSALAAAGFTVFIPDLLSYSLRADTSILNALLISLSCLLFAKGLKGSAWFFAANAISPAAFQAHKPQSAQAGAKSQDRLSRSFRFGS